MNTDVQGLLAPRFRVIADYPAQKYQIGDIIKTYESAMAYIAVDDNWSYKGCLKDYPALFKRLPWYSDRNIIEMPKYLLWESSADKEVVEVRLWREDGYCYIGGGLYHCGESNLIPATLEQYNEYTSNKK